jgi:hypothetical protein
MTVRAMLSDFTVPAYIICRQCCYEALGSEVDEEGECEPPRYPTPFILETSWRDVQENSFQAFVSARSCVDLRHECLM